MTVIYFILLPFEMLVRTKVDKFPSYYNVALVPKLSAISLARSEKFAQPLQAVIKILKEFVCYCTDSIRLIG